MVQKYDCSRLRQLTPFGLDESTFARFRDWILGMEMERDGEYGKDRLVNGKIIPGFWSWIVDQATIQTFVRDSLYNTFVWVDRENGEVVATGTIARDDRGVKEKYGLRGLGLWGGVNVRFDLRGQGIGKHICACMDEHISSCVDDAPRYLFAKPVFHLFTTNPTAEGIYEELGFRRHSIGEIDTEAFGSEHLWSKNYQRGYLFNGSSSCFFLTDGGPFLDEGLFLPDLAHIGRAGKSLAIPRFLTEQDRVLDELRVLAASPSKRNLRLRHELERHLSRCNQSLHALAQSRRVALKHNHKARPLTERSRFRSS